MRTLWCLFFCCAFAAAAETVQTLNTPRTFPKIASKADWLKRREEIREQILVSSGLWPMPEKTPLQARIFGKIERDGYSVEKVYFQSLPGFYVAGNLYRPLGKGAGSFPAILNPHGHWEHGRLEDTSVCSIPGRCINFARQGMIAFSYDLVGYNDTRFADAAPDARFSDRHHSFGANSPTALLWSVNLMGLQTWNSIRALDFLASLPDVDTNRLACTGESGGGTQTFMLGAIDDRLAAQAPAVMVSHTMQGGCICENMPGLRVRFSNMEIAAAAAPRPQIMVAATGDWTKTMPTVEGPAVESIYKLFGADENLRYVQFDYGHNYNQASRQAVYQWFDHWLLHQPDQPVAELSFKKEADDDLRVFPDGKLPSDAVSQQELVNHLIQMHRERLQRLDPTNEEKLEAYKNIMATAWARTLQLETFEINNLRMQEAVPKTGFFAHEFVFTPSSADDLVNGVCFGPEKLDRAANVVILAHSSGKSPYTDGEGNAAGLARKLLEHGFAVVTLLDAGAPAATNQASILYNTYNRTRLQKRVRDLVGVCEAFKSVNSHWRVILYGSGTAGLWTVLAAPAADAVVADCCHLDASHDKALMGPDLFCPGIRNIDSFEGGIASTSPRPLLLYNVADGFPTSHIRCCYRLLKSEAMFDVKARESSDNEIIAWFGAIGDKQGN